MYYVCNPQRATCVAKHYANVPEVLTSVVAEGYVRSKTLL